MLLGRGIGLDIEDNRMRMATLTAGRSIFRLDSFGEAVIPDEALENGRIKRPEILADVMRALWSSLHIRERRIVAAIPNQHILVRNLTLPPLKPRDVFKAARYHFLSVLPLPLEETVIQVSGTRPKETGELEATLVATRKSQVEELTLAIRLAGLRPVVMEIRPLAARRVLGIDEVPQVLVDVGSQATYLSFFERGHLRFMRTLFPGKAEEVAGKGDTVIIDQKAITENGDGYLNTREMAVEINRTLEYWSRENGRDLEPRKMVVIGSNSNADSLAQTWEGHWSIGVERGNPWRVVESPRQLTWQERFNLEGYFIVALGLAARRVRSL